MACNLRTARPAAEEQEGNRRRLPRSVWHGYCVCFRRRILNNKAAHIAEWVMCAAGHKQARGDGRETKKENRSIQIGCSDWSECNYRTWKSPGKSMVCRLSARGFISNCTIQNCNPRNHIAETVISYHVLKDIVWCAAQFFKVSICVRNTISRFRKAYAIYSTIPSKNWLTSTDNALFKF